MAYDNTEAEIQNPNTVFRQPSEAAPAKTTTVVAPEQKQAIAVPQVSGTRAPVSQDQLSSGDGFNPPAGSRGPPQGAVTVQSEPTPHNAKPPIDPRPLAHLEKHRPEDYAEVMQISEQLGISPERFAAHWHAESRLAPNAPRGQDGEVGPMQVMPSTAAKFIQQSGGRLDLFNPHDNKLIAGMVMRELDGTYGKDSFISAARYNGGARGGEGAQKAAAYARRYIMPTAPESAELDLHNHKEHSMDPAGLVRAGVQGGPEGFFRYAASTASSGLPTSDVWRQAEATLVGAMIAKGDMAGAQHARDFVMQMSHQGTNMNLMAAHQALQAGNGKATADLLAKAHAFFPDGTIGRFRTDGKNVWAETTDENNPGMKVGPSFQVTPDKIAGMLNQTTDPHQYLKTLTETQKAASEARLREQHGDYYASAGQRATERSAATIGAAQIHANATTEAARIRAGAQANKPDHALDRATTKAADTAYGDIVNPANEGLTLDQKGRMSELHKAVMMGGATSTQAERVARGLSDGTLQLLKGQDGNYGVVSKDNPRAPIAYLPPGAVEKLLPPQQAQASPVGAGATSALGAQQQTSNLAGTVPVQQSSALPMRG